MLVRDAESFFENTCGTRARARAYDHAAAKEEFAQGLMTHLPKRKRRTGDDSLGRRERRRRGAWGPKKEPLGVRTHGGKESNKNLRMKAQLYATEQAMNYGSHLAIAAAVAVAARKTEASKAKLFPGNKSEAS